MGGDSVSDEGYQLALKEAKASFAVGGIPVGSSIIGDFGQIIGFGRNLRVQTGSHILHAETAALDSARYSNMSTFEGATLYTTLSPCRMCTGAILLFRIKKVVIGENKHMSQGEDVLRQHGVEVVVLNDDDAIQLLDKFIETFPERWEF